MSATTFLRRFALPGTIALLVAAQPALAQRPSVGGSAIVSALHPSEELGSGSLTGVGGKLDFGVSSRIRIGLSGLMYRNVATEPPLEEARVYDMVFPALHVRASLVGNESDLALLLGAGAAWYDLDAVGGLPAEKMTIPALGVGIGARVHLAGPLYLEFEGHNWVSYVRNGELGAFRSQKRQFSHSPDVRIGLSLMWRKKDSVLASFEDLPLSYARDFRPVDATAVVRPPISVTQGRDHLHGDRGEIVPFDKSTADSSALAAAFPMTKAIPAPEPVYEERKLGTIYFQAGSHDVDPSYRQLLQDVAQFLAENPDTRLLLRGFTDASGSIHLNFSLAERRGTTVRELLVRLFDVDIGRVDVVSRGIDYRTQDPALARRTELVALIPVR